MGRNRMVETMWILDWKRVNYLVGSAQQVKLTPQFEVQEKPLFLLLPWTTSQPQNPPQDLKGVTPAFPLQKRKKG